MDQFLKPKYNFEDVFPLHEEDVTRIQGQDGLYLQPGDVVLVRSMNVPQLGEHIIVVTGPPVMKEHGMRPQVASFTTSADTLLKKYQDKVGYTLLKFKYAAKKAFYDFYGITMDCGQVIIPNVESTE